MAKSKELKSEMLIDAQQAIEDVRQNMFERYMEQNPEGSWELFQQEYHYLFHPDEMEGEK